MFFNTRPFTTAWLPAAEKGTDLHRSEVETIVQFGF
jgi:hypothetical protein